MRHVWQETRRPGVLDGDGSSPPKGLDVKAATILATFAATLAGMAASALPAHAAVTSGSIVGGTATLNLDDADNNVTVSVSAGLLFFLPRFAYFTRHPP